MYETSDFLRILYRRQEKERRITSDYLDKFIDNKSTACKTRVYMNISVYAREGIAK